VRAEKGSDAVPFCSVAYLAQELDISFCIAATLARRNDVVVFQPFLASAFHTSAAITAPDKYSDLLGDRFPTLCNLGSRSAGELVPEPFESGAVLVKSLEKKQSKLFCRGNFVSLGEGPKMMAEQITCYRLAPTFEVRPADLPIRPVVPVERFNLVECGLDLLDLRGVPQVTQVKRVAAHHTPVAEHVEGGRSRRALLAKLLECRKSRRRRRRGIRIKLL
jgi:hypothetical protein